MAIPALRAAGARLAVGSDSQAMIDPFEECRAIELDERLGDLVPQPLVRFDQFRHAVRRGGRPGCRLIRDRRDTGQRVFDASDGTFDPGVFHKSNTTPKSVAK